MSIFVASLKETFKSCPFVFKQVNKYFAWGWFCLALLSLGSLSFLDLENGGGAFPLKQVISYISYIMVFLAHIFTMFIVPYYAYKFSRGGDIRPFWIFISETVWPIVISHIKAFFIILFFFLLLIIPGIYKAVRFTFINQAVFFDKAFRDGEISALKSSHKTTQGFWWLVFLAGVGVSFFGWLSLFFLNSFYTICSEYVWTNFSNLKENSHFLPLFLEGIVSLLLGFYWNCLNSLFLTQFYFKLKEHKGEEISC